MATTQLTSLSKLIDIPIESHYDESYIIRLGSEGAVLLRFSFNESARALGGASATGNEGELAGTRDPDKGYRTERGL